MTPTIAPPSSTNGSKRVIIHAGAPSGDCQMRGWADCTRSPARTRRSWSTTPSSRRYGKSSGATRPITDAAATPVRASMNRFHTR